MKNKFLFYFFIFHITTSVFAQVDVSEWDENIQDNEYTEEDDFLYNILVSIDLYSHDILETGIYDNGITYTIFIINDDIRITVSSDEDGIIYAIGNAVSNEAMMGILEYLTILYSEPVPCLDSDGFTAFFHDAMNKYIKDDFPDYIGTFTLYSNQLFVEEVISRDKIIIQRQWCTPDFYKNTVADNGEDWGFIPSWEEVEIVFNESQQYVLPAQYTVRSWKETGDSLSAIAGMSFIYGDSAQWQVLYNANRHKLPRQDNPHLVYPGTILDIPSLIGEERSGMWNHSTQTIDN